MRCILFPLYIISILPFTLLGWAYQVNPLDSILDKVGPTLCTFLTNGNHATRKLKYKCGEPQCSWDSWLDAIEGRNDTKPLKIVLSIAHNGFGNQLWEHTFAFMVAESLQAQLLIKQISADVAPGHVSPPNTAEGFHCMEHLLPDSFEYSRLPSDSEIKKLCDAESFFVSDRPFDWRNKTYSSNFKKNLADVINDDKPRCLKFIGFFQGTQPCREDSKKLWLSRMNSNFPIKPAPEDIVIYLRCLPRHYLFNSLKYYQTILSRITYSKMWLIMSPTCPKGIPSNNTNNPVHQVLHYLYTEHKAQRWNNLKSGAFQDMVVASMLHDLSALTSAKKLIIPASSWGFWGGYLSSADEIHVNVPPHHLLVTTNDYIYHDQGSGKYFGKWNGKKMVYDLNINDVNNNNSNSNNNSNNISSSSIANKDPPLYSRSQEVQKINPTTHKIIHSHGTRNNNNNNNNNDDNNNNNNSSSSTNMHDAKKKKSSTRHHGSRNSNGLYVSSKNTTHVTQTIHKIDTKSWTNQPTKEEASSP